MGDSVSDRIPGYMSNPEIRAALNFLVPSGDRPVYHASEAGADAALSMTGQFVLKEVVIRNGRVSGDRFSPDEHGFCLVPHGTRVRDFTDGDEVASVYEPEIQALIKSVTGAGSVVIFDHTLRSDSADRRAADHAREPSRVVHNDYTAASAAQRVRDILPDDEARTRLGRRYAIVNVWRPIRRPALTSPLALCDAGSLSEDNLVPGERRARDRIGELMLVSYNPAQKWYYFPAMTRHEALVIKTFDSAADGRAKAAVHSAFDDPASPPGAYPRESLETRCFAFF